MTFIAIYDVQLHITQLAPGNIIHGNIIRIITIITIIRDTLINNRKTPKYLLITSKKINNVIYKNRPIAPPNLPISIHHIQTITAKSEMPAPTFSNEQLTTRP